MGFTLREGRWYEAAILLRGFTERKFSNEAIAKRIAAAGFERVKVTGSGSARMAVGKWARPTSERAEIPRQIAKLREIT